MKPVPTERNGLNHHDSDNDIDDEPDGKRYKRPKSWHREGDKLLNLNIKSGKTAIIKQEPLLNKNLKCR